MAYLKQFSLALGIVAAAGIAAPALAHNHEAGLDLAHNHEVEVELAPEAAVEVESPEILAEGVEVHSSASMLTLPEVEQASAIGLFDTADIESALLAATVEVAPEANSSFDLAQAAPGAVAVSPAYIGAGGNIGIGNRGDSALSSFGFNIISKISLSNRFSVRVGATATNDRWGFTIPVTYNFNTIGAGGFTAQPYVGIGAEIPTSGDVGLLVNAGADVPISQNFTLNGVANFRLTSGFALGIGLGVGYNFPFFFD
jgi:hypothetical protein